LQQRLTEPERSQIVFDATTAERIRKAVETSKDDAKTVTSVISDIGQWFLGIESRKRRVLPSIGGRYAERATIFLSQRRYSRSTQEEGASKYAGDFEFWHHSFPTAQVLAQRAVATLSSARKCQKSIYFFLVLRHINGNFSTSTCI
jgi:hypothetical protein